jgi:hypothetical protein
MLIQFGQELRWLKVTLKVHATSTDGARPQTLHMLLHVHSASCVSATSVPSMAARSHALTFVTAWCPAPTYLSYY